MKERILTSLLTVFAITGLQAQTQPAVPRLVVGLAIDQLRADYIEAFSALYGERGFKRLLKEGRVYANAEYDFINIDRSSATAAIYTGTSPYYNGIPSNRWMDRTSLRLMKAVDDPAFMGIYTSESSSPRFLQVSTLSDELMVASDGEAEVYSIAPTREMAVLAAGHAAKGAFWLNDVTGKWGGSTYYGAFPKWVSDYNDREGLDFRINDMVWRPYHPVTAYRYVTSRSKQLDFKHSFSDERYEKYKRFITSPYVNDEVNRLVKACFDHTPIGKDYVPDLLTLAYYAGNYAHKPNAELSMEIQDMYVRLDNSIGDLLELIDRKVGLEHTLFFITSTGYTDPDPADPPRFKVPAGEFHIKRCAALLNMYLMAVYGPGQYVETYYDRQIYLNHKLIEDRKMNLVEVMNRSAEFVVQMSGVQNAYSAQRLLLGSWTPKIEKIRNTYHPNRSGDIYVEVMPGWTVVNDESFSAHHAKVVREAYSSSPLVFMGFGVKPKTLYTPVKIAAIVPTVAHFMRIRAPNACPVPPITDLCK